MASRRGVNVNYGLSDAFCKASLLMGMTWDVKGPDPLRQRVRAQYDAVLHSITDEMVQLKREQLLARRIAKQIKEAAGLITTKDET